MRRPPHAAEAGDAGPDQDALDKRSDLEGTSLLRRIEDAADAPLAVLASLLDGIDGDRYDPRQRFRCPRCQATGLALFKHAPAAAVRDVVTWRCDLCQHVGTVWELRRLVLEDIFLLDRFLAGLGVAVAR